MNNWGEEKARKKLGSVLVPIRIYIELRWKD